MYKALRAGLHYSVRGRLMKTEEGQEFEENPWDAVTLKTMIARGYVEEIVTLQSSEPVVEVVEKPLSEMKKSELVELAKSQGLSSAGSKADLLARLSGEEE